MSIKLTDFCWGKDIIVLCKSKEECEKLYNDALYILSKGNAVREYYQIDEKCGIILYPWKTITIMPDRGSNIRHSLYFIFTTEEEFREMLEDFKKENDMTGMDSYEFKTE